jgi:hypothetical protein
MPEPVGVFQYVDQIGARGEVTAVIRLGEHLVEPGQCHLGGGEQQVPQFFGPVTLGGPVFGNPFLQEEELGVLEGP